MLAYEGTDTSVTIPNSVTTIEARAFYYHNSLTSVTIGDSVTSIGQYAFSGCSGLTSVTIPNSVNTIGQYAFFNCSGLRRVTIGTSVTSIAPFAFEGCDSLSSLTIEANTAPTIYYSFGRHYIDVFVPCGTINVYQQTSGWSSSYFRYYEMCSSTVTITVFSNNEEYGTVSGSGEYDFGATTTITATPAVGYHFKSWNDGNTHNPRSISANSNITFTATFAINIYNMTVVSANGNNGLAYGSGEIEHNAQGTIAAVPYEGYQFDRWSDGNRDNPRNVTVISDTTLTAYFVRGNGRDTTYIYDTTYVDRWQYDTTIVNNYIHDTTILNNYIHDTSFVDRWQYDTTYVDVFVPVHDTTFVNNFIHDTTIVTQWQYDTAYIDRWQYVAISEDLVDVKNYPFRKFKPQKEYKFEDRKQCLNPYQLKVLENLYIVLCEEYGVCDMFGIEKRDNPTIGVDAKLDLNDNEFYFDALNWWDDIVSDGGMEERRKYIQKLGQTQKKLYKMHLIFGGINFCLLVFYMQCLAPVDVCKLKAKQVVIKTHTNGREYYHVEGVKRSKTGEPVPISCIRTRLTDLLFLPHFYNANGEIKNGDDWFISSSNGEFKYPHNISIQLKKVWAFINGTYKRLFKDSIKHKQKVGNKKYYWVDIPESITAYCFRHTFASIYYYNGGTLRDLALLMGRDEEYIFNYIHSLVSYDEILEDKENIMGTFEESPVKGIEEFF